MFLLYLEAEKHDSMIFYNGWQRYASGLGSVSILLLLTMLLPSCEKTEGRGGTGSISGTLTEHFYNDDFSSLIMQKPAVDEEIFILFGAECLALKWGMDYISLIFMGFVFMFPSYLRSCHQLIRISQFFK